jgi:hypothetical protein
MFTVNFTADYLRHSASAHRHGQPGAAAADRSLPVIIPHEGLCMTLPVRGSVAKKVR